jgi:hypothetical protein
MLGGRSGMLSHPPEYVATVRFPHRFRFQTSTGGATASIIRAELLNQILVATTTTTWGRVMSAVKLNKVEIWGFAGIGTTGVPALASVEFLGLQGPSTVFSDVQIGMQPAHVVAQPPPDSLNRFWSNSGQNETDALFTIVAPADSIVDVHLDCVLQDGETAVTGGGIAGATVGQVYYSGLDSIVSANFTPVSLIAAP